MIILYQKIINKIPEINTYMFLNSKYVLANELIQKMDIHIANISILYKSLKDLDNCPIIKLNSLSFINKKSGLLPNNIQKALNSHTFTDLSDKLPVNHIFTEYGITRKELEKNELISDIVEISGKRFYVFEHEFIKKIKNKIPYILDYKETIECYNKKLIDGYIQLKTNKFLTWY